MKRSFIVLIGLLLAVPALLFATGQQEAAGAGGELQINEPGRYPVVLGDTPYEIDVFTIYLDAETDGDRESAAFTQYLEELTNVHVNWIEVADSSVHTERQNLLIASGDLPDVFMSPWGMSGQEAFTYGLNGTLVPLTEHVEERMPNLMAQLDEYPVYKSQIYMPDGNIYALPVTAGVLHVEFRKKCYAYMPWLDELGLEVPETTEELRKMLVAFRDEDPNGNGERDEIPFMASTNGWQANPVEFIMNSFIYTDSTGDPRFLMRDNGTIRFVADTPEWRAGLTYMADLVADDLLAQETFVQQNDQLIARVENPDAPLVGVVTAGHFAIFTTLGGPSGRFAEYRSIPPVEGPEGVRQTWYLPRGVRPHTKVTNVAERPDIIAQWADWFYGGVENVMLAKRFWSEGDQYRYPTAEEERTLITRDGTEPKIIPLESIEQYGVDKFNDGWGRTAPEWVPRSLEALTNIDDPANLEYRLMKASVDNHMPYLTDHWLPSGLVFDPEYSDEIADLTEALVSNTGLVWQWSTEFIIGERDIRSDAEWDAYLNTLESAGLERYVELWTQRLRQAGY
jgi:putative aldouronate transport system substrate-binding protein